MGGVFISYRRSDTAGYAGRLQDRLRQRFGAERVFRDIDTLAPGVDFVDAVEKAVGSCSALIALIGRNWLQGQESSGKWGVQDLHDYPRMEISTALERGVLVIPVLVEGAIMPRAEQLPESLQRLARINALEISDSRWDYDVGRLIDRLQSIFDADDPAPGASVSEAAGTAPEPPPPPSPLPPLVPSSPVPPAAEPPAPPPSAAGAGQPVPPPSTAPRRRSGGRMVAIIVGVLLFLCCAGGGTVYGASVLLRVRASPSPTSSPEAEITPSPSSLAPTPSLSTVTGPCRAVAGAITSNTFHSDGALPNFKVYNFGFAPICVDQLTVGSHMLYAANLDIVTHTITIGLPSPIKLTLPPDGKTYSTSSFFLPSGNTELTDSPTTYHAQLYTR